MRIKAVLYNAEHPEAVLRNLKDDLEKDTVQYSEPPDLEELFDEDWVDEQEAGPSIEL